MIWSSDQNDVHILPIQHPPEVFNRIRLFAFPLFTHSQPLGDHRFIQVRNDGTIHFRISQKAIQVNLPDAATTNYPQPDFAVWPGLPGATGADPWPGQHRAAHEQGGVADELPAWC